MRRIAYCAQVIVLCACSRPKSDGSESQAVHQKDELPQALPQIDQELAPGAALPDENPLPPSAASDGGELQGVIQLSGPEIMARLKDSPAKFTLLNLWASWCGPCRREFPMLMGMRDNIAPQGIDVVFVSLDEPESIPVAVEFAEQHGLKLPIYNAKRPIRDLKAAIHPGWPGMLPATFLFDHNGKLLHFWGGPVYEHELLPVLERAISGEVVSGETRFGLSAGKDLRNE